MSEHPEIGPVAVRGLDCDGGGANFGVLDTVSLA